jgi:hypothetical protein
LELNYNNDNSKHIKKKYVVKEIIKEEKEGETPLKINKKEKKTKTNWNNNRYNKEEYEIMKTLEIKKEYSKRIRNHFLNKTNKEEIFIKSNNNNHTTFNFNKFLGKSKSCKKFKCSANVNLNTKIIKRPNNIGNNISAKMKSKKNLNLNNSFNISNFFKGKEKKIKDNIIEKKNSNHLENKTFIKNEKLYKNKNNINLSLTMNNFNKRNKKEKIGNSKSAKRLINNTSNKKNEEKLNIKPFSNSNNRIHILKKNKTMSKLTFSKTTNKKENINLNKSSVISFNKNKNIKSVLNNTICYRNIKIKKNISVSNFISTNRREKKIVKKFKTNDKEIKRLNMNK